MNTITIGVDLAKNVFSMCEVDRTGHVLRRHDLKRDAFAVWLAQVPAGTVVAMEACSGAHHWARRCLEHGLESRIMAAQSSSRRFAKAAGRKGNIKTGIGPQAQAKGVMRPGLTGSLLRIC